MKTLLLITVLTGLSISIIAQVKQDKVFVCLPCGHECDKIKHSKPGSCEHCQMKLVDEATIKHKSVPPRKVCDFISTKSGIILLDVRTKEEFLGKAEQNFGTLKNAINIPVDELEVRLSELRAYKDKTILVFCSHSHRSPRASYLLTQNGFREVYNMEGGMSVMPKSSCTISAGQN